MPNDHYVPRFYLKNFQISGNAGFVYSYKRGFKPTARPISKLASSDNFDRFISPQNASIRDSANEIFNEIENDAAPLINKLLLSKNFAFTDEEIQKLAYFIASLANRTLWAREKLLNIGKDLRIGMFKRIAKDKDYFHKIRNKIPELAATSEEEFEEVRKMIVDFESHFRASLKGDVQDYYLNMQIRLSENLVSILLLKNWLIIEPMAQRDVFITSDNPVILLPSKKTLGHLGGGFLFSPVFIPLSPKRALLLDNFIENTEILLYSKNQMKLLKDYMIKLAHKFVFSNVLDLEIQKIFDSTKEGENLHSFIY